MKYNEEEPKIYFERNLLIVIAVLLLGLFFDAITFYLFSITNPFFLVAIVPAILVNIQAIWLILNPYIIVYDDRFIIKSHILSNREFYFLDFKSSLISEKPLRLTLVYNDNDQINLSLIGIKRNHLELLKNKITTQIKESLKNRSF